MTNKFRAAYKFGTTKGFSCLDKDGEPQETRTKQNHKEECDINNIVKKYDKGRGLLTHVNQAIASYGDFTQVNEYQVSLDLVNSSQQNFAALPSDIRRKFGQNPGEFLEFATNPENLDAMVDLGLAVKPSIPVETITKVEVVNTTPETPQDAPK